MTDTVQIQVEFGICLIPSLSKYDKTSQTFWRYLINIERALILPLFSIRR